MERLNNFMEDHPSVKGVEIIWPSYEYPGSAYETSIYPVKFEYDGHDFVEFAFSPNSN